MSAFVRPAKVVFGNGSGSNATSLALTPDASWQAGDVAVASFSWTNGTAFTVATGWTIVGTGPYYSSTAIGHVVAYKVLTTADLSATHTFSIATGTRFGGEVEALVGIDTTTPVDVSGHNTVSGGSTNLTTGSVTTVSPNVFLKSYWAAKFTGAGGNAITLPGTHTEDAHAYSGASSVNYSLMSAELTTQPGAAGTVCGPYTATVAVSASNYITEQVAFRTANTNLPPTGTVASQTVAPGATVTLDGSTITDPEGQALTYAWTPPGGVTLSSNSAQKPTFTAGAAGSSYTFSVTATDPQGASTTVNNITVKVVASGLYTKGREGILDESIKMNSGTIAVALVDTTTSQGYAPNLATDQFLSDIPSGAIIAQVSLTGKTFTGGVFDATDASFAAPPAGHSGAALVVYQDTGTASTSRLVAFMNQGAGFPVATDGTAVNITWDNGSNKIFAL